MSLVELIARADERGLAASGLACVHRCLPLLGPLDEDALRPLWASLESGGAGWGEALARVRGMCGADAAPGDAAEAPVLVRRMLTDAPASLPAPGLRAWADACAAAALQVHRLLDGTGTGADADPGAGADPGAVVGPLAAGELRRQVRVLELLASDTPGSGLRQALAVSTEGRRIVRAVVARRARVRVRVQG